MYVHYEDAAVQHLFQVVCGLDSMVVGEAQILGQVREALRVAQHEGAVGRALNELGQQALRVGKRAHAETGHRPRRVGADDRRASTWPPPWLGDLAGRRALVVGRRLAERAGGGVAAARRARRGRGAQP